MSRCLLQAHSQFLSNICKSYCAMTNLDSTSLSPPKRWAPTVINLTPAQHWIVSPGLCTSHTPHSLSSQIIIHGLRSACNLVLPTLTSKLLIAFSSQCYIKGPSSQPLHLSEVALCHSPIIAWSHPTVAHCWVAVMPTSLQAQLGQMLHLSSSLLYSCCLTFCLHEVGAQKIFVGLIHH